jgi:NAD+ synthetase
MSSEPWPVIEAAVFDARAGLALDAALAATWLEAFLRDELIDRRGIGNAVVGLSGGVDSAVTTFLCARALGPERVWAVRMPYRTSHPGSLTDARSVVQALGCRERTLDISAAADGYLALEPQADARRRGNVLARIRMLALFDQAQKLDALPIGTGNKSERLLGYFTWHADDAPPLNPLGDLFKTQVWELARELGVPQGLIDKAPSADLEENQTDEGDLGITYAKADAILSMLLLGYDDERILACGFSQAEAHLVRARVDATHWKRHLPTTAMLSGTAINEFYLRPVDY